MVPVLDSLKFKIDPDDFEKESRSMARHAEISIRGSGVSCDGPWRWGETNLHPEGGSRVVPLLAGEGLRKSRLAGPCLGFDGESFPSVA